MTLIFGIVFLSFQIKKNKPNNNPLSDLTNANSLFSPPAFYIDSIGRTQPIDTKIVKSTDPKYAYMNTTNVFKTYFPQNLNSQNSIKFEFGNASINFSTVSKLTVKKIDKDNKETIVAEKSIDNLKQVTGKISKNKFSYPKIYQNGDKFIDVNYTVYSYKLSEEIVLNKFQDFPELTQHLTLNNAYAKVENQTINFYHKTTNKLLWFISPPYMYEQNNINNLSLGLQYDLKCDDSDIAIEKCSNFSLTKKFTADGQKWLSDPSRKYPIVIDPQINSADALTGWATSDTVNFSTSVDTTIKQEGTGSIKIVGIGNTNCWGIAGSCDAGCNYSNRGDTPVYNGCSASSCANTNCWTLGGVCDGGCVYGNRGDTQVYNGCSSSTCANTNCWTIGGVCDGGCVYNTSNSYTVYDTCGSNTCGSYGWYDGSGNTCTFDAVDYSWPDTAWSSCTSGCPGAFHYTGPITHLTTYSCTSSCYYCPGAFQAYEDDFGAVCNQYMCALDWYTYGSCNSCSHYTPVYGSVSGSPSTGYLFSGSCSAGSPPCYKNGGSNVHRFTGSGSCGQTASCSGDNWYWTSSTSCTWVAAQNSYTVNSATTAYNPSGGCGASCYKTNGSTTPFYTGNTGCGSNNCSTGSYYASTPSTCTWVAAQNSYTVNSPVTAYSPWGIPCGSPGSGNCYKINGSATPFNTASTGCGSNNCTQASYYGSTPSTCVGTTSPANSLNDTMTLTVGATDLSTMGSLTFWVRSNRTGTFMTFGFGESVINEQTTAVTISSANTWEQKTWDISGIAAASRNAVTKFTFKNTNSDVGFTFWFDDIQVTTGAPNSPSGCLIRETPNDSLLTPFWADNSSNENGFQIEKNTNGVGYTFFANLAAGVTGIGDSAVSSGNTYAYRVRSFTNVGSTSFSTDYAVCSTLDLHTGSFKFEGVKMEGVQIY